MRAQAAERRAGPGVRLFLALAVPAATGLALEAWARTALGGPEGARIVPAAALHVTALFIGRRDRAELSSIEGAAERIASQSRPPRLTAATVDTVPRRRPRLLAVGLHDEGGHAAALHTELTTALAQLAVEPAESAARRPYWPHVTVARARGAVPLMRPPQPLPRLEPFEPPALTLYRSEPGPEGSRYTQLAGWGFSRDA